MKYVRIYTGTDGLSHFMDVNVETKDVGEGRQRSETMKATGIYFNITPSDLSLDWHTPDRRQFVITLEGEIEREASDGTKRIFGPGEIMLADDLTGRGHISRAVNNKPAKSLFVTLG